MSVEETIQNSLEAIEADRSRFVRSEDETCRLLILPILDALHWPPLSIFGQQRTPDGPPDYTLRKGTRDILLIEVKKLGTPLDNREIINQLARYLIAGGVRHGLLTDGSRFILYENKSGIPFAENGIWSVDIVEDKRNAAECLSLLLFDAIDDFDGNWSQLQKRFKEWQEEQKRLKEAIRIQKEAMDEVWNEMKEKKDDLIMAITAQFKQNLGHDRSDLKFEETLVRDFVKKKVDEMMGFKDVIIQNGGDDGKGEDQDKYKHPPKGRAISFKIDGREFMHPKTNKPILWETAEWLIRKGRLGRSDSVVRSRDWANILTFDKGLSWNPKRSRLLKHQLSNDLWIYDNFDSTGMQETSRQLLKDCGYDADLLRIEWPA